VHTTYHMDITYWGPPIGDGYGGEIFSVGPIAMKGRWEDRVERVTASGGEDFISNARVFVDQDVAIGGYLYKGTTLETNPRNLGEAARVIARFDTVPDLRNLSQVRTAYL
jgi:hypothetical protein